MAINISNLTLCPERIGEIYFKALADQRWFDLVNSQTGISDVDEVKFVHADVEANLAVCCTTPDGTDTIEETVAPVVCVLTRKTYCERDLMKVLGTGFRVGAGREDTGRIGQLLGQATLSEFVKNLSILAFQGDTINADPVFVKKGFNLLNGYLKLATQIPTVINTGNVFDLIVAANNALPLEGRRIGGTIGIFVGEEVLAPYQQALINQNLYHFAPGTYDYGREAYIPGVDRVRIIPTPGLNGTNRILVSPLENMYWLTNEISDKDTFSWEYSAYHQQWILYIKTIFGVTFVRPDLAVALEFDPSILTNYGMTVNANIVSPLGDNGGVLTSTAPVAVTGVTVAPATATIAVGDTVQLGANIQPANATDKTVVWTTSAAATATVNATGLVTGVASGIATITATTNDGSLTGTSTITVTT